MSRLEKYSSYKDSGVEWFGKMPEHWEISKFRYIFTFSKGLNITKENLQDSGIPCVNYGEIHSKYGFEVIPEKHDLKCVDASYLKHNQKSYLENGDFVFSDTSEDIEGSGNFTYLNSEERIFAGYHTVIARCQDESFEKRFIAYLFDSISFRNQVRRQVKGVKVYSITNKILKKLLLLKPPKEEQAQIVNFLTQKTAQIDEAIKQKEELISLLKERRQVLIHKAVTQGLDATVKMKDSGVEWLGEVPEHWVMEKVKYIFNLIIDPAPNNNDLELLSIYTDIGVKPRKELAEKGNKASTTDGYWKVRKGDFIVNKLLAWMGAVGLSAYDGVTSPAYDILRAINPIEGVYFHELFRMKVFSQEMKKHSRGIMDMRLRLYFDKFGDIRVPLPPIEEQKEIVKYIKINSDKIENAISLQKKQIEKIKEYKATLIDSLVTGKRKV